MLAVVASFGFPAGAQAVPVIVLGAHGAHRVNDSYLPATNLTPPPAYLGRVARARTKPKRKPSPTIASTLTDLRRRNLITRGTYLSDHGKLMAAERALTRLRGSRWTELAAVLTNLHDMAVAGQMTPSRLPALFLTLESNRRWWTTGPLLSSGQRVELSGSDLVWEYYPGQGIEIQPLGSFGKANGLFTAGPPHYEEFKSLLDELIPLAARRAGGLTWEYYFDFGGGTPPWTSAMSQGTALESLTRAFTAFGAHSYLDLAHNALPVFGTGPPTGVTVHTGVGNRYVQYTFAPGALILNAFLQTLIGLYDYSHASGDARAAALFAAGDREARAEVPRFDTGAWSLYQPGDEDTLEYHQLVTGFLQQLCQRTLAPVYCHTATNFTNDLSTPPALAQLTTRIRHGNGFDLRFHLSKYSHVGVVVLRGDQTLFGTSAEFGYGTNAFAIPSLKRGSYRIHLAATDLAGNFNRIVATLTVV
jgi:D-glucuronyl C5-epimerase C-terminus